MPHELDFELLSSRPKATGYLIKVIEQKGQNLWQGRKSEEERAKALKIVGRLVRKKYGNEATDEKIFEIWANLQFAFLCPETDCKYKKKLDYLKGHYPVTPAVPCQVVVDINEAFDDLVRAQFRMDEPARKKPRLSTSGTSANVSMETRATQTGTVVSELKPEERDRAEVEMFCEFLNTRLAILVPDPLQQRRIARKLLKHVDNRLGNL
ncbi:hypothetical protein L596_007581 [Steinernema carpocapsae]|uniref:Uncharacterized protein n=1 Tax=Steinernema carpocapsae TaxID=34508 RepID=A0A4U5P9S2_STECR|nr:hypothetical protein L596_007581 [Steinernema carpocapsae]